MSPFRLSGLCPAAPDSHLPGSSISTVMDLSPTSTSPRRPRSARIKVPHLWWRSERTSSGLRSLVGKRLSLSRVQEEDSRQF